MEPSLSPDIVGAWWFPQDVSVDAQRTFRVLERACSKAGVEILEGWVCLGVHHGSLHRPSLRSVSRVIMAVMVIEIVALIDVVGTV